MGRGRAKLKQAAVTAVPALLGLTVDEADAVVAQLDLVLVGPDGGSADVLEGLVLAQRPGPGVGVPRGTRVTVWTSGPGGAGVREPAVPPLPHREGSATPS